MTPWLVGLALSCILLFLARRVSPTLDRACERLFSQPTASTFSRFEERAWRWGGFLFLLAAFAGLEAMQSYYFTQDDVLATELPGTLFGGRQPWFGLFSDFNPYTLMGTRGFSLVGVYPPIFLAYTIARYVLANEYATMEVFAFLHLVAGYWVTRYLAKRLGQGPMVSTLASLSFLLSGPILIMGRSWHMTLPIVVWVPFLLVSVLNLKEKPPGWRWTIGTGLVIGLYFQVGFTQVWAFALLFWGMAILFLMVAGDISIKRALWTIPAFLFGLALALPILWAQVAATRDMVRAAGYGNGIEWGLASLFLPYPVKALHPNVWGSTDLWYMGHFYYFGTLFMVLFTVSLVVLLTTRPKKALLSGAVWTLCGAAALWMTLGNQGGLWELFSYLPLLKQVNNHPFRILPFFVLFAVMAGGIVLEQLLSELPRHRIWGGGLATLALCLLAYHVAMARPAFYSYGFKPYPPLPPDMSQLFKAGGDIPAGRILPISPPRSIAPDYPLALNLSLPAVYGVASLDGYDPLTQSRPPVGMAWALLSRTPAAALKAYGVRWLVVHRTARHPIFSPNPALRGMESFSHSAFLLDHLQELGAKKIIERPEVEVWALPDADPMAFPLSTPGHALPLALTSSGVSVDTSTLPAGGIVVVNFLWYPNVRAVADGREVPSGRDRWGRVVVDAPPGVGRIEVRFGASWGRALVNAGLVMALALLTALWLSRQEAALRGKDGIGRADISRRWRVT